MNNKIIYILSMLLLTATGIIVYQNFIISDSHIGTHPDSDSGKQLYTCGMHPDIISDEPGNCPICDMKLTPIKSNNSTTSEREILYWVAPMNPNEIYNEPGKSKMGMDLVPVYADQVKGGGIVKIDPEVQQNMNLKTTRIESRALSNKIITNGVVKIDESREYQITSRVNGWIEKMYVNTTGQKVRKGETLLEIYSPELVAAQEEYLSALKYKEKLEQSGSSLSSTGDDLIKSSITKMKLLELTDEEISKIKTLGITRRTLPITSPSDGAVLMKNAMEGDNVKPGSPLLHIADLSKLWILADIYENEIAKIKSGTVVNIILNAFPGKTLRGKIDFIYPVMDNKTRTTKVRILINNHETILKPEMLTRVEILGKESQMLPVVQEQSIIRSGVKNIVILSLGNGKFKPVEVSLGSYAEGYYQVTNGLTEGMEIVSSAQFLIDSESNLRAAISDFSTSGKSITDSMTMTRSDETVELKPETEMDKEANLVEENEYGIESELIRTGIIDVESIDKNNDGKLFECPMDWNIISDESGNCPACEMKLKEYSTNEIKSNLDKNGYKYKHTSKHDRGGE